MSHGNSPTENLRLQGFVAKQPRNARQFFLDLENLAKANPSFGLCLLVFLVTTLPKQSINILLQYTSKRYNI
jgi:hypothetical protein